MNPDAPSRVVFDCMVFLQALARPSGPAARLFMEQVERGRITRFVSDAIVQEVHDVLDRPRIRAKNPTLTDEAIEEFLSRVVQSAVRVDPVPAAYTLTRDPDDEPYVNLAIAVEAAYLVARDNDLLDLVQDAAFRTRCPSLTIVDPVALLRILDRRPTEV